MTAFSIRPNPERRVCRLPIASISPSPFQPRRYFNESELHSLAESIRRYGLLSPLLVRRCAGGYELIAGERRLRAMHLLGWTHTDAIICATTDRDCALVGLIENLQREDLHFLDEAEACRRILREHGLSQEELAANLGKSPSALANLLRLLKLSREVRTFIRESSLSERHARALLKLNDTQAQLDLARRSAEEQLSVRQLEGLIAEMRKAKVTVPSKTNPLIRDNRLVINALRDTVRQLRKIGVPISSRVETRDDLCEVIITIRPPKQECRCVPSEPTDP